MAKNGNGQPAAEEMQPAASQQPAAEEMQPAAPQQTLQPDEARARTASVIAELEEQIREAQNRRVFLRAMNGQQEVIINKLRAENEELKKKLAAAEANVKEWEEDAFRKEQSGTKRRAAT